MKNLTSSVYSFEKLRTEDYLYVDKTEFIWNLINPAGESYFLSRPRRFGKSLTISPPFRKIPDHLHAESRV